MRQLLIGTLFFIQLSITFLAPANAGQKGFDKWYTTNSIDQFPCMNDKEVAFIKRIIQNQKSEQKIKLLSEHRRQVTPSARRPANIQPEKLNNQNFICPPFKGVRNPYPQDVDFGKAALFERVRVTESSMDILSGIKKNERWEMTYNPQKGYYEGKNPRGTETNFIPIPTGSQGVRFMVQYLIFADKTPPSLTLCYKEELHSQCNPYPNPALPKVAPAGVPANGAPRIPASIPGKVIPAKS